MNRLQSELLRLYLSPPGESIGPAGTTRCLVLEVTSPPGWDALSKVWHGIQAELELPAPAIAVSGKSGIQLWFSVAEPVAPDEAQAFLDGLRVRFMPDVPVSRVRVMPSADPSQEAARLVPARQESTGNWSAFVAPDLAPVFAETPWLDIPPNEEGQAALLRGLQSMKLAAFEAASKQLRPASPPSVNEVEFAAAAPVTATAASDEAKHFLLQVMKDGTVPLSLRIDAAKALLQYEIGSPPKRRD